MLKVLESVDSTNSYIKSNYDNLKHLEGVMAYTQTKGRGRRGREWESAKGSLNLSIPLKHFGSGTCFSVNEGGISLLAALSVCDVIERLTGVNAQIKWPNDILIGYKKVCGILLENTIRDAQNSCVVIGIGVNVNNVMFSDSIKEKATSIKIETGKDLDLVFVAGSIIESVKCRLLCNRNNIISEYLEKCITIGKRICTDNDLTGTCISVNEDGSLLIKTDDEEIITLYAGEVSIRTDRGKMI